MADGASICRGTKEIAHLAVRDDIVKDTKRRA